MYFLVNILVFTYWLLRRKAVLRKPLSVFNARALVWFDQLSPERVDLNDQKASTQALLYVLKNRIGRGLQVDLLDDFLVNFASAGTSFPEPVWTKISSVWHQDGYSFWPLLSHDGPGLKVLLQRKDQLGRSYDRLFDRKTWRTKDFWDELVYWLNGQESEVSVERIRKGALETVVHLSNKLTRARVLESIDHWPRIVSPLTFDTLMALSAEEREVLGSGDEHWTQKPWTAPEGERISKYTPWVVANFPGAFLVGSPIRKVMSLGMKDTLSKILQDEGITSDALNAELYRRMHATYTGTITEMLDEIWVKRAGLLHPEVQESFLVLSREMSEDVSVDALIETCKALAIP